MSLKRQKHLNNKGFALLENILAFALFSVLALELALVIGRMTQDQATYKNMTTAAHIAETIAGQISVVNVGYQWLKTGVIHERYFDRDGNETVKTASKFTVQWTVIPDKPISGMRVADFHLIWNEDQKKKDLGFRVTR
jgi:type II secretory pathway pseudopilin PulG